MWSIIISQALKLRHNPELLEECFKAHRKAVERRNRKRRCP